MSMKEKYKALISTLLNAWGGKATVKSAKSVEINGTAHNPAAVVVKTWTNGLSWYRKYSDGWIEQGGKTAYWVNDSSSGYTTITLNTPYTGTNYQVILTPTVKYGNSGGNGCIYYEEQTKTTTNFHVRKQYIDGLYVNWYTCGF